MVGKKNILTVSYGTFSCTLEGFEDPFTAMKAIAEHLRDLSADENFFDHTPPRPNHEQVANLAQASSATVITADALDDDHLHLKAKTKDETAQAAEAKAKAEAAEAEKAAKARKAAEAIEKAKAEKEAKAKKAAEAAKKAKAEKEAKAREAAEAAKKAKAKAEEEAMAREVAEAVKKAKAEEEEARAREEAAEAARKAEEAKEEEAKKAKAADADTEEKKSSENASGGDVLAFSELKYTLTSKIADKPVGRRKPRDGSQSDDVAQITRIAQPGDDQQDESDSPIDYGADSIILRSSNDEISDDDATQTASSRTSSKGNAPDEALILSNLLSQDANAGSQSRQDRRDDTARKDGAHKDGSGKKPEKGDRKSLAHEAEDEAIERLMQTTNNRIEHDESSARRETIAHLKAAVAATKADSSIGTDAEKRDEEELHQYQDDLAQVSKPLALRGKHNDEAEQTPLVLVGGQRVKRDGDAADDDLPSTAPSARPLRISLGNQDHDEGNVDAIVGSSLAKVSFEDYASQAGAVEMPSLLEAAAAHFTYVERVEHFSRPMLMRKISGLSKDHGYSREDGLRAFGSMLRDGTIEKHENGKFRLGEASRFMAKAH